VGLADRSERGGEGKLSGIGKCNVGRALLIEDVSLVSAGEVDRATGRGLR
jgi:hypothetical protein